MKISIDETLPINSVTKMPIKNQQWEADLIAKSIAEHEAELERLKKLHAKRLGWIKVAKEMGRA